MSVASQLGAGLPVHLLTSLLVCCLAWVYSDIMHVVIINVSLAVQYDKRTLLLYRRWMNLKDGILNRVRQTKIPNTLITLHMRRFQNKFWIHKMIEWHHRLESWRKKDSLKIKGQNHLGRQDMETLRKIAKKVTRINIKLLLFQITRTIYFKCLMVQNHR